MKKAITLICITLSIILILDSFNVWHAVAMFYLAGVIPGTRTALNAETMLSLFALLIGFVLARISNYVTLQITSRGTNKRLSQHA